MKRLLTFCLVLMFCASALGTPIGGGTTSIKMGAFTGPVGGSEVDDNMKAATDHLGTDTDSIIASAIDILGIQGLGGTAAIFYVDSAETSGNETGLTWADATDTLDEAISLAALVTAKGSIILVAAGHSEALSGANGVDVDKANIVIWGLGVGEGRPLLDYTNLAGEFVIGADNVKIVNLQFLASVTDVAHAIDVEAGFENFEIINCRFYVAITGTDEFTDSITTAAGCDNGKIINNDFEMGAGGAASAINTIGSDYLLIKGNRINGDYSVANIEDATTASIWITIQDNILLNGTVGGTAGLNTLPVITLKSDTSAIIVGNSCFTNVVTPDLAIVAADGFLSGNTYNEVEGSTASNLGNLEVGQKYTLTKAAVNTGGTDDLFLVAGGNILITFFYGEITTNFAGSPGTMTIELDSADDDFDSDFSTTVNVDAAAQGDSIVFTSAIDEGVLSFAAAVSAAQPLAWICSEGMIEQTLSSTGTGNTTWYIQFIPLDPGVTVTAQ